MANSHPEEVIDISSSDEDDDRIVAFAESMNIVPEDPEATPSVTVVGLHNNPSGQSTFKLSRRTKSRNTKAGSLHEQKFSREVVAVTPKITSHFSPSSSTRQNLASSAQRKLSSSLDPNQPVRISIPMGGQQALKIQIGDKKLRRESISARKMKCPAPEQQGESMPEVVVLSDDDDGGGTFDKAAADRQLTAAIEESIRLDALKKVKDTLKRNQEMTMTPTVAVEDVGRKRAKLEPVAAEEYDLDKYEVDNAYAALLHVIRSKVKDGEYKTIEKKMEKRKAGIKPEHLRSKTLQKFLEKKKDQVRMDTTGNPFTFIQSVLDELRRYSKPATSASSVQLEPVPGTSTNTVMFQLKRDDETKDETKSKDKKKKASRKHIRKLEKALENCAKEIRRLETADDYDYDLEDFDNTTSSYVKLDRYRARFMKIYQRLSELQEFDPSLGRRQDKKFKLEGSRYPEINLKIAKFVNRSRSQGLNEVMPDFSEIHELVKEINREKALGLSAAAILSEAQETFQAVGEKLASRRIHDEIVDRDGYLPEDPAESVDPADHNEEMAKKLGGEKRLREKEKEVRRRRLFLLSLI